MNPRKSPSPRRTKKTPKAPKAKPAPFARLMWADDKLMHLSPLPVGRTIGNAWRCEHMRKPVLVIDARPESLEAMKEAGARAILPSSWPMWQKREMVAALMQSWGLTRGTV